MTDRYAISPNDRILVTGAAGFIGVKVVETLLKNGFSRLRCFVRPSGKLDRLRNAIVKSDAIESVELFQGDLASVDDCKRAADGVSVVYHLATGSDKSFAGAFMNCVLTTRNLLDGFLGFGEPKRFVNVSSFAVYSTTSLRRGAVLDETCPLEKASQERYDPYSFGKLKQEELVREYGEKHGLPYVILRPGTVFGPGKAELSGRVGIGTFGIFIQIGGNNLLPLTFVDNCAEAIVLAGLKPGVEGEIYNVVDDKLLTSRQFLRAYRGAVSGFRSVRIPYVFGELLCRFWENYSRRSHGQLPPVFNRHRCAAEWKPLRYTNEKIQQQLDWQPKIGLEEAMAAFLAQYNQR